MTSAPSRKSSRAGVAPPGALRTERTDPRSAMARASDLLPSKPYRYGGDTEPPAVIAARERWRRYAAEDAAGSDPGESGSPPEVSRPASASRIPAIPFGPFPPEPAKAVPVTRCESCGYVTTAVGHRITCGETP